jgi:hypothetical protein
LGVSRVDRLGDSFLCFSGRYSQPPGQNLGPGSAAELRGISFRDQPSYQSPIEGLHLLVEVLKPLEQCLLLWSRQRLQRERGKFPLTGFDGVQRCDNSLSCRMHVRMVSRCSDALNHPKCARKGSSLPHPKCARAARLADWSAMTSVGPADGVDVGRTQGSDRDDRDPLFASGQTDKGRHSRRVVCQHRLAPKSRPQGAQDGAAAQSGSTEKSPAAEVRTGCHCCTDGVLDGAENAGRQETGTDAGRVGGGVAPFRGAGH